MDEQVFYLINRDIENIFQIKSPNSVLNETDYVKTLKDHNSIKAVVILAELTWNGSKYSDFYGFQIAYELRAKYKFLFPIIITSLLKQTYFENLAQNQIKFKLLFGRGTAFIQIGKNMGDEINDAIQKLSLFPLSSPVLTDINEMLLNQRGFIIDKITHDLRVNKSKEEIGSTFDEISKYLDGRQASSLKLEDYKSGLLESTNKQDNFNKIKEGLILKCQQELLAGAPLEETVAKKKHRIVVLEDDPGFGKKIVENLKDYFEEIILKEKAREAIECIDADKNNSITGIITDWRLYEDYSKKTYWQLQGYEVLDYAAKKRFIALFSLTSLHDRYVNDIRNKLGLEIHLFKKQYLELEGKAQWEMMADTVRQKCDSITYLIASQPTGTRWETDYFDRSEKRIPIKSLKTKYIEMRNSSSWKVFEEYLTEKSDKAWRYYKEVFNETFYFESMSNKYGYQIAAKDPDLKHILIVRRIYLALILSAVKIDHSFERVNCERSGKKTLLILTRVESPLVNVYCVLNGTNWENFKESFNPTKRKKKCGIEMTKEQQASEDLLYKSKLFANWLCITPKSLPGKGILPEERNWLLSIGIDPSKGNSVFDYEAIEDDFEEETD